MWYKVNEFSSKGQTQSQISRQTGLHRHTVAKYLGMSEDDFMRSQSYKRNYAHKLDRYEEFVAEELRNPAGLSAAQKEDHLRQKPDYDRATCSKTVYNFVQYVRRKYNIPLPRLERSTYSVLQILSISFTDKTPLKELFEKTKFNNVKELSEPLIPGLFD